MKKQTIIFGLTAVVAGVLLAGCKEENKSAGETTKEATKEAAKDTGNALNQAKDAVAKTVESAKETGAKVVANVKAAGTQAVATVTEKAKEMAAPASAKAQELIESAKSLFSEGKLKEALAKLNETSSAAPSGEQQSVIDNLKAQIDKALKSATGVINEATQSATNALHNLLGK